MALHQPADATYSSAVGFSEFALRIVVLFLPGVVSFLIIDKLTAHRPFKPFSVAMYSFLLGFYCYVVYAVLLDVLQPSVPRSKVAFVINHHWLHRLAHVLRVSRKFGDFDLWSHMLNSNAPSWVIIRDREQDLMYDGWIAAFSDGAEKNELLLGDVKVFRNSTGDMLYEASA